MVKKGNFNKAPLQVLFKRSYQIAYRPLVEVEFYFVSEHLPDDSDKFAGTVPKSIVMRPAFSHLGIILCLEGGIVFHNIVLTKYHSAIDVPDTRNGHND